MTTTLEQLIKKLNAAKRSFDSRAEVWVHLVDPDTHRVIKRIYRGSFHQPRNIKEDSSDE